MDTNQPEFKQAIRELDQQRREKTVGNKSYWKNLLPQFPITDNPFSDDSIPYLISDKDSDFCLTQLKRDGYFITPKIIPEDNLKQLEYCIKKVNEKNHPARYAFLYDVLFELWGRLGNVLSPILGEGYQLVPDEFDAYLIQNNDANSGTSPHRDNILEQDRTIYVDGLPTLINLWIPITDATTLNSCIHVIPHHADPYLSDGRLQDMQHATLTWPDISKLLQYVRAVPAPAGAVLGWDVNTMHWGGASSSFASEPRLSMAMYFQSAKVPPYHKFTMDIPASIPFDYRLYLVEKIMLDPASESNSFKDYQRLWHNYHNLPIS